MQVNQLDTVKIGERLRLARENHALTQVIAANKTGMARTTLVAIEKGQRKIKFSELKVFADLYKTSVNKLLREQAIHTSFEPRFRQQFDIKNEISSFAVNIISEQVKAEVELESLLGIKHNRNYPPERPVLPGDVVKQAELDSIELRQWLGLGLRPIQDIISILEFDIGIRVFIKKLDGKISGLFVYEDSIGACVLLNGNHRKDRRTQTAAHELGHFISSRNTPDMSFNGETTVSREEKYANAFASSFLMPSRTIISKFQEITFGSDQFTRRHIIALSHSMNVSREAIVRRLEELKIVKNGTWDWFDRNGGISDEQVIEVLGDRAVNNRDQYSSQNATTFRLNALMCQAWKRELMSEGQLSNLVGISRVALRNILDSGDLDGSDAEDAPSFFE
ncbi:MAG: ImmA/IrrE family metallo-endopeptidase [Alphaproteobacteria bacterium]|nr:ImmA/IrrE family metallo-endopeptidase [Alphaproteobacteria bacterium]